VAETTVKSAAGWCRETVRDERGGEAGHCETVYAWYEVYVY
jgi:hypothetical protein